MKKRSKGFSIPELLAVIVIMGILITIASFTYNGISKSMKERAYNNKLNLIKTKSVEYATDNNINNETISVAKLVMEGYLDIENITIVFFFSSWNFFIFQKLFDSVRNITGFIKIRFKDHK